MSPLFRRRWQSFRRHRRGYGSLWCFAAIFFMSLCADFLANDKPLIIQYEGQYYFPFAEFVSEQQLGGELDIEPDWKDKTVIDTVRNHGWLVSAPVTFGPDTINYQVSSPSPPSRENLLGTDDQGRDVLSRVLYGLRTSILFGLSLTLISTIIGISIGAIQGFFGGYTDLLGQRILEIWSGLPVLYLLILLSGIIETGFWSLLLVLMLFSWIPLVDMVRAEFLKTKNFEYVTAARALGVGNITLIIRHILPNAMVATITYLPFMLCGAVATLASLDFLGFGLPKGEPSLGELIAQGKHNLQAPWLGITAFFTMSILLTCLVFIGEAARDALDPRGEYGHK